MLSIQPIIFNAKDGNGLSADRLCQRASPRGADQDRGPGYRRQGQPEADPDDQRHHHPGACCPMAVGMGEEASEVRSPMAVVVIGGLLQEFQCLKILP